MVDARLPEPASGTGPIGPPYHLRLQISDLQPRARLSVRGTADTMGGVSRATGLTFPKRIGEARQQTGRGAILRLGPDEWLILAPPDILHETTTALEAAALAQATPISVVDVSDRTVGVGIRGEQASEFLNYLVPTNPESLSPGRATRTLVGRVEALVWRVNSTAFEIEVPRSYVDYFRQLLEAIAAEIEPLPYLPTRP